ncbi:MAG TPA: choice-of-anchor D domain-containing protein, partial [Micromonosporaceae bacterium]
MTLAGGLAAVIGAAAVIVSLTFANDSAAAETDTGTQRVSVGTGEEQSTHDSREPAISADGRYVAFTTDEPFDPVDKLNVSQDVDGGLAESAPDADVYVRDTKLGTTTLISHGVVPQEDGTERIVPARGESDEPSISANGRFVAFRTAANNISDNSEVWHTIVVCDRDPDGDGQLNSTCRFTTISTNDEWDPGNPQISADGLRLSYDMPPAAVVSILRSAKAALAARDFGIGWVEVVNLRLGTDGKLTVPAADDRTFVSAPAELTFGGKKYPLDAHFDSTMAAGGTHVAFVANYRLSNNPDAQAVYDYDVATGGLTRLDLDASGNPIGAAGRQFSHPALSGDGRRYAFADRQSSSQISVRLYDRGTTMTGTPSVEIASRTPDGTVGRGAQPAFSADGRYLAFTTPTPGMHNGTDNGVLESSCLGPGDNQSYCDIVVRDVIVDHDRAAAGLPRLPAELASPSAGCTGNPCEGTGDSGLPRATGGEGSRSDGAAVLSADGAVVAYGSAAADLIAGGADTNRHLDVFRRRFAPALAGDPQDFGQVPLGTEALKDVPLTHVGAGPLSVTAVAVDGADFDVFPGEACTTVVLHATEKCIVSVRFKPTVLGPRTASLRVTIAGVETPLTVSLAGTGVTPPAGVPTVAPDKLDFGARPVLQTSPIKSVTVRNTGDGPLSIQTVTLGAPTATTFPSDYQKVADT